MVNITRSLPSPLTDPVPWADACPPAKIATARDVAPKMGASFLIAFTGNLLSRGPLFFETCLPLAACQIKKTLMFFNGRRRALSRRLAVLVRPLVKQRGRILPWHPHGSHSLNIILFFILDEGRG